MNQLQHPFGKQYTEQVRVLVLGIGESGAAMVRWCKTQGAHVVVADTREKSQLSELALQYEKTTREIGISEIHFGQLSLDLLNDIDIVAISPGLSPIAEPVQSFLQLASEKGIPVWSEIEFFAQAIEALRVEQNYQTKIIAITGTNGKTTTTALTGLLCERAGMAVAVAGNISPAALDKLLDIEDLPHVWVLELSSFQLQHTYSLNADAATILNISQDHFDWHGDMNHYVMAKAKIFGDKTTAVLNRDDELVIGLAESLSASRVITFGHGSPTEEDAFGIFHDTAAGGIDWLVWAEPDEEANELKLKRRRKKSVEDDEPLRLKRLMPADALRIKGRHNASNALAAIAMASAIGLPMGPLLHGLREYQGEPHRVQSVAIIDGVEYIDDSKGTNVGATIAALVGLSESAGQQAKIILIAGGEGKGQDFQPLLDPVARFAKSVILIGRDTPLIKNALASSGVNLFEVSTLEAAVLQASELAHSGDIVLLSPACASFDMFKDYAHRAEVFVGAVNELAISRGQVSA
ncbi:UDP-N-acetylmuramoyl-L-alanine--D-glutamate ligase [Polynucleobacter sp. 30F-ANTBAC]|uniref:UDP-N-acetylmuramoyl-L-alanine--D-glutamate ligase n=1 Tax=Polynucleobacter sp. 30F-ANTBAC TaxID=2689095 RepID=UPI00351D5BF8|nr:UDP-N-acetylmuramoyl-L-alanine--D-glutamate ligase [Polynucleobacter sp. 30F-ANTBAC]